MLRSADLIVTMGTGLVNHCVQSGNAYQKALDIAQEIVKQVNMPHPHLHGNRMFRNLLQKSQSHCTEGFLA